MDDEGKLQGLNTGMIIIVVTLSLELTPLSM